MQQQNVRRSSRILADAVRKKNYKTVEDILLRGTSVDETDYNGDCALHHAVRIRDLNMVKLLLKYDAEMNACNNDGERPYNIAVELKEFAILEILLKHKAFVDINDIDHIIKKFPKDLIDLFYNHISILDTDSFGYSALHRAVEHDDLKGVQKLLSRGAKINQQTTEQKYTPLHLVKSAKSLELLLQKGAEPNLRDQFTCTPLYTLAMKETFGPASNVKRDQQARIIEILLKYGADSVDVIYSGQIALDYGKDWDSMEGFKDILKFMALDEHKNQYIEKMDLKLKDRTNILSIFYKKCLIEVTKLQTEKILDNMTYYDLITINLSELTRYAYRENIVKIFENTSELASRFPYYSDILQRHYNDALERRNLQENASSSLSIAVPCIDAKHIVTQTIIKLLDIGDMQNLITAFQSVNLRKSH